MKWKELLFVLLMNTAMTSAGQGKVVFEGPLFSKHFNTNRIVRIYLPPSYEREPERRFPVLYLHDGQNTFTTVGTNVAFGWGNWELDKTVNLLCAARKMQEIIMVAVDCSAERYLDYRGSVYGRSRDSEPRNLKRPPPAPGDNSRYEEYTQFLIEELKPKIDREYRTLSGATNTGVMGSSLGGLCSLVLAWEHPETFGKAASLSGAFQVERTNFLSNVLRAYRGKPKPIRIYLDSGTIDFTGGDDGRNNTDAVAAQLRRIGWKKGDLEHFVDLKPLTEAELEQTGLRRDKWKEAQTSQHNEFYWRLRAWRALSFLFPPK